MTPVNRDHRVVMVVVCALATVLMVCVVGILFLAQEGKGVPDVITNIASAALGSLGTLLASTRSGPEQVRVVNEQADPVPVEPGG